MTPIEVNSMNPVHTEKEVEAAGKKATEALYGSNIEDFKIRTLLPFITLNR